MARHRRDQEYHAAAAPLPPWPSYRRTQLPALLHGQRNGGATAHPYGTTTEYPNSAYTGAVSHSAVAEPVQPLLYDVHSHLKRWQKPRLSVVPGYHIRGTISSWCFH